MPRGAFEVDQPEGARWTTALELLAAGEYVVCMGLGLALADENRPTRRGLGVVLTVRAQTRYPAEGITSPQAAAEIENAERGVAEITERSKAFGELVSRREILYELIDDYGMGAIRLAVKDGSGFRFEGLAGGGGS